jgi:hypothetical protein
VCAVYEVLCSISDGHYTESGNSSFSDEEKWRHAHAMRVSYLSRREMRPRNARLVSHERTSPFYLTCTKIMSTEYSPRNAPCASTQQCSLAQICAYLCERSFERTA